jgi:O-antigen ligase
MGIITFLISIVALMGLIHMFKTGSFGKAFAIGQILNIIGKIGWLRYLAWLVVSFVLAMVIIAFTYIPFLGWIIVAFLEVLLVIFLARSIGIMYDSAMGMTTAPAAPAATPPPPPQPPKA